MSTRIGLDLSLVQGAGGNTGLKLGGVLWVKASGTWLAEAWDREIMVPVNLQALRDALTDRSLAEADIPGLTLRAGLRASVETPFHALIPAPCTIHVHCVATLALAIRPDAETVLAPLLRGMNWGFMPFLKPGIPLTWALMDRGLHHRQVIILGNHGLIVSGETPSAAEALLREVQARLDRAPGPSGVEEFAPGFDLSGTGYRPAAPGALHALALDPVLRHLATQGALAPDFVVFFGPNIARVKNGADLSALSRAPLPLNAVALVEGHGVAIRDDVLRGTEEILHGLHATLARFRLRPGEPRYLTQAEIGALMSWDAEKYRQSLNGGRG